MSDIFSRGSSSSSSDDMVARKEAIKENIRNEITLAGAQELMNKASERCFTKCIQKPGTSLSGTEQTCLTRCFDQYMEAFNIVSRTYIARLGKERQSDDHYQSM